MGKAGTSSVPGQLPRTGDAKESREFQPRGERLIGERIQHWPPAKDSPLVSTPAQLTLGEQQLTHLCSEQTKSFWATPSRLKRAALLAGVSPGLLLQQARQHLPPAEPWANTVTQLQSTHCKSCKHSWSKGKPRIYRRPHGKQFGDHLYFETQRPSPTHPQIAFLTHSPETRKKRRQARKEHRR